MTTIVWHGPSRTLAVDAMATVRHGVSPILRSEQAYKIIDLVPSNLVDRRGEKLLAIAVSGSLNGVSALMRFIIEALGTWKETAGYVKKLGATFLNRDTSTTAILVTNKKVYVFTLNDGISITAYRLQDFVAAGSGGTAAYTAYRAFGASARDAVLASSTTDPATGFLIFTTKVSAKGLTEHYGEYINDLESALLELRQRTATVKEVDQAKKHSKIETRLGDIDGLFSEGRLKEIRTTEKRKSKDERDRKRKIREEKQKPKVNTTKSKATKTEVAPKVPVKTVTSSRRKNKPK